MVKNGFENNFQIRCSGAITVPLINTSYLEDNSFKNILFGALYSRHAGPNPKTEVTV
jgi:hypothetical protein